MKKSLLFVIFAILAFLGGLHYLGQTFYFYWDLRWYDNLAHFLGGLSMGFLCLWLWYRSGFFGMSVPNKKEAFLTAILGGMLIGLGWEFFEFAYGIANPIGSYALDTFNDLASDFIGASLAGIVGARQAFYE
jgi:hypothetical protein